MSTSLHVAIADAVTSLALRDELEELDANDAEVLRNRLIALLDALDANGFVSARRRPRRKAAI
jgi:hypothetical protein